ncbi:MAG: hypothetical protein DCC55_05190 [Chloroflexi bacterium]|nr:MAG: hypothetical protein DCC55_05190 [Chloroflexota bacterium]
MLETTLSTAFVPGINVRGQVAGANWIFLRPSIHAEQVLCIGMPATTTLTTLANFSRSITVVDAGEQQQQQVTFGSQQTNLTNIHLLLSGEDGAFPLPAASVDLVLIVGGRNLWRLRRKQRLRAELRRLLKPDGMLYYEYWGLIDPLRGGRVLNQTEGDNLIGQPLWLTPLNGEMRTAVPVADQMGIDYFRRHELYSPSLPLASLKQILQQARRRSVKQPLSRNNDVQGKMKSDRSEPSAKNWRSLTKRAAAIERWFTQGSKLVENQPLFDRLAGRRGVLIGGSPTALATPPQYLQALATAAGIRLDGFRWGLSARGEYSSRKLLFFLFDGANPAPSAPPTYIVKMVRDPVFNPRLENEHQALSLLKQRGIGDRETLPQVVFFGHHAGLAIVGETVITGAPFHQHTQATADCPYLHAALEWLTDLGAATANPNATTPGEAASILDRLFTRFMQIYRLTAEQQTFLAAQLDALRTSRAPLPLVFQHGDPGPWNVMVTESGRVAFLDWEAAEVEGLPLWDLFYFLRSYCIGAARTLGIRDPLAGFTYQFLGETPLSHLINTAIRCYCTRIGLSSQLVEPLFYTCWMHRALKEATRLTPDKLESGHYVNLLRLSIAQRPMPAVNRLFAG